MYARWYEVASRFVFQPITIMKLKCDSGLVYGKPWIYFILFKPRPMYLGINVQRRCNTNAAAYLRMLIILQPCIPKGQQYNGVDFSITCL